MSTSYITKSKYVAGLQCERRLWRQVNAPIPYEEPAPGTPLLIGLEVGRLAHRLFPGGVLVDEPPWAHDKAVARTAALTEDRDVAAIFEAAFAVDGVRTRVDVLQRLPRGRWGLLEVKCSGEVKDYHLDDIALQAYVLGLAGLKLGALEIVHIDKTYVRGKRGIDVNNLFTRQDVSADVKERLPSLPAAVAAQLKLIRRKAEPKIEPGSHCKNPFECEFWDHCTADKPADWIEYMPRLRVEKRVELIELGIEAISDIPDGFALSAAQNTVREVVRTKKDFIADDLAEKLEPFGPPAIYMDFETVAPAIPLFVGTSPFETVAFQWSVHEIGKRGQITHREFLADGREDPRREFVETLLEALGDAETPIIVYSSYEQTQLKALAAQFRDLAKPIMHVIGRLRDLLPVVRNSVYLAQFEFSHSIKSVYPALCSGSGYDDLDGIAEGGAAQAAFLALATGATTGTEASEVRRQLLAYCQRDTQAMVEVHEALRRLAVCLR